jgi:hypothetical protein
MPPRRRVGRSHSRERRRQWMDTEAAQNARPEVASRAGNASPAAPYSAIGMPGDASLRSFRDPTADTPSPDPHSVQDHVSATAPRMDLSN